jgi:hypothetical protein
MKVSRGLLLVLFLAMLCLFCAIDSFGQSLPVGSTSTFTMSSTAVSLPGGKSTVAGTDTQMLLNITPSFSLRDSNFISPIGNGFQYFGGGFRYNLNNLSKNLNNMSTTLNGFRFQFYFTGTVGVDRVTVSNTTKQHYGTTIGGGVSYALTSTGTWQLGAEVEYAKFPGLNNNTAIVKLGPSIHF